MKILDLFSGIGGISLGLERAGMQTVAFCEIEPFQRAVLRKHWPEVPAYEDIRAVSADLLRQSGIDHVDIVAGGFPCQDVSVAGKGRGVEHGERSGLWREMFRIICELMPRWVLAENVPALRTRGGDIVIANLEAAGYAVWPLVVGAWSVGAPHRRDRVWIVAHRDGGRPQGERRQESGDNGQNSRRNQPDGRGEELVYSESIGREGQGNDIGGFGDGSGDEPMADAEQMRCGSRAGIERDEEGTGQRRDESARRGVEHSGSAGLEERHSASVAGEARHASRRHRAFPARPGEPQHEWEAPRLEWPVGDAAHGLSERLVRFANRNTLRSGGNSVVPQVVEVIGRAIMSIEEVRG